MALLNFYISRSRRLTDRFDPYASVATGTPWVGTFSREFGAFREVSSGSPDIASR